MPIIDNGVVMTKLKLMLFTMLKLENTMSVVSGSGKSMKSKMFSNWLYSMSGPTEPIVCALVRKHTTG